MTCRDAGQNRSQHPWTFTAVCVMVVSMTLLLFGLSEMPAFQLLPGYVAAYLLIGFCIFGPVGKPLLLRQATVFLLPGALLLVLGLLNMGLWAGGWLLGLPAWGVLLSRWTPEYALKIGQVLKFLGLLVLGLVIFTFNMIYPIPSLGLFLLPFIPLIRQTYPEYRAGSLQTVVEIFLGIATVAAAFAIPTPEGAWSSPWIEAGGAATVGLMIAFWARGIVWRSRRVHLNEGAII